METTPLRVGWPAILAAGVEGAGGKAWALARLAEQAFPVPPGLVIPTAEAAAWLEGSGLRAALVRAAAAQDDARLAELHARLLRHPPAPGLLAALAAALAAPPWQGAGLAVRSSAPQEDAATASFAGIHRSHLNVRGAVALAQAVVSVWASPWTPAAAAYRQRLGLDHGEAGMAVLIMPMVAAVASGIGFTCDPRDGRDDRLVIHANWGLGESLVAGQASGDEILLGEPPTASDLRLLDYRPGAKAAHSRPLATGGVELAATPASRASARVLDDRLALQLGRLLRLAALALDFSRPACDGEWAWDGQRLWLLQLRPITASGRCTYPGLAEQPDIWSRGNTIDVVPDPLSPMDWSISRKLVNLLLEAGYRLGGFPLHPGAQRAGLFHGRLYLNLSLLQWEAYHAFGVEPGAMNRLVGGHQPEIRLPPPRGRARLARGAHMLRYLARAGAARRHGKQQIEDAYRLAAHWRQAPLPQGEAAMAQRMREFGLRSSELSAMHYLQGSGGASLSMLADLIEARLPGEGHALTSALLAGGPPSVTGRQSLELIQIARAAMADPPTRRWLEAARASGGDWRALPADNAFRRAFADFLERYGHRAIYETYLRSPRWRERPQYLLESLPDLAATDLDALAHRQRQAAAAARARLRAHTPLWLRPVFALLARNATTESNDREAARSALIALCEVSRLGLLHIGRHWQASGWLHAPEDIFLLLDCEVLAVLDGQRPGPALVPLLAARRRQWQAWWAESAPEWFYAGQGQPGAVAQAGAAPSPLPGGRHFQGTAVGSGVARGAARLLRTPEEGQRLRRGEILVVPSTDPAWTPLFLKAGGLVMETGGFMSHGAIVAREFGIPAVVNLPGILARIEEGTPLEVDGGRGTVRLLEPAGRLNAGG